MNPTATATKIDSGTITIREINPYDTVRNRFITYHTFTYAGPTTIGNYYRISEMLKGSSNTGHSGDIFPYIRFGTKPFAYQAPQWQLIGGIGGNYFYAIKTDSGFVLKANEQDNNLSIGYFPSAVSGTGVFKNGKLYFTYEVNTTFTGYYSRKKASLVSQ